MIVAALACAVVLSGDAGKTPRSAADKVCIKRREINAISALDDRHALARPRDARLSNTSRGRPS